MTHLFCTLVQIDIVSQLQTVSPSASPANGPFCGHTNSSSANSENDEVSMTQPRSDRREVSADRTTRNDDNSTCSLCMWDYAYDLRTSTGAKLIQRSFWFRRYLKKCENVVDDFEEGIRMFTMWRFVNHHTVILGLHDISRNHSTSNEILFSLNTVITMMRYLYIIQISTFRIFGSIYLGNTELRSLSRIRESFARKRIKE